MRHPALSQYAGPALPSLVASILDAMSSRSCELQVTGPSRKTIRLFHNGLNLGYVNGTVIKRGALVGYHFLTNRRGSDSCPKGREPTLLHDFCTEYGCAASDIDIHEGAGSNADRTFLLIRNPAVALRVLCPDTAAEDLEGTALPELGGRYVEGRLIDVVMKLRERDAAARAACLAAYGFSCYTCGINLKQKYRGISTEIIHVHHEEPLSEATGEREFDPVATMKPLCPNCHAVVHSRKPPYTVLEVRSMIESETLRSTGAPTAWHPGREALCAHLPPRGQGATPSSPGLLHVRALGTVVLTISKEIKCVR